MANFNITVSLSINEEKIYGMAGLQKYDFINHNLKLHFKTGSGMAAWLRRQVAESNCSPRFRDIFELAAEKVRRKVEFDALMEARDKISKESPSSPKKTSPLRRGHRAHA